MKNCKPALRACLLAVSLAASALVHAQTAMNDAPPQHSEADRAKWQDRMAQKRAKHEAQLHEQLKITAAQEPAWKNFTQAMTPPAGLPPHEARAAEDKLTTPQRMEKMLARMQEHQQQLQIHLNAVKTFYAVLSPEQQKTFDENHERMKKEMQERMAAHMHGKEGMMGRP